MKGIYRGVGNFLQASDNATITGNWAFTNPSTTLVTNGINPTITSLSTGAILAYTGSAWVNLNSGADGTVLIADNTQTSGLRWGSNPFAVSRAGVDASFSAIGAGNTIPYNFPHGLGTDNVKVSVWGAGSISDSYTVAWKRPDGLGGMIVGPTTVTYHPTPTVLAPASGSVNISIRNNYISSQNFEFQIRVTAL